MTSVISVINLTSGEVSNTHRIANADELMIIGTGAKIILLVDNHTTAGRINKYQNALKDIAISTKCVTSDFKRQFMLTFRDFEREG